VIAAGFDSGNAGGCEPQSVNERKKIAVKYGSCLEDSKTDAGLEAALGIHCISRIQNQ
jgi:hypothetical protein